jgi:hypothetical protein
MAMLDLRDQALMRTSEGHMEAELVGRYTGLVNLAVGTEVNNVVAGRRFGHDLTLQ